MLSCLIHSPLQSVHRVDQVFLKAGRIGKYLRAITLVAPRQQITVIHVRECCEFLEYMRVLFHILPHPLSVRNVRRMGLDPIGTQVYQSAEAHRQIFLGHRLTKEAVPLCPCTVCVPLRAQYETTWGMSGAEPDVRVRVRAGVVAVGVEDTGPRPIVPIATAVEAPTK